MSCNLTDFKGSYALITGASSGLGQAFAEELAIQGMNLVLVARDEKSLSAVAQWIKGKYDVAVKIISLDLSESGAAEKLHQQLQSENIKVRLLCNNAANGYLGEFLDEKLSEIQQRILLNQIAMVSLCHLFFKDLATYKSSAVINISSAAAFQPMPYMAVYAASKAFVQSFSQALHYEWKNNGIYVQTLTPGAMATSFNSKIGLDLTKVKDIRTPQKVVQLSLHGFKSGRVVVEAANGIWLQKLFANFFPAHFVLKMVAKMFQRPENG